MEEDLTVLKRLIAGSYGSEDQIFGGHSFDSGRARKSLVEAGDREIGLAKFLELHREFLESKGRPEEHIVKQLERVKNLSFYFSYD